MKIKAIIIAGILSSLSAFGVKFTDLNPEQQEMCKQFISGMRSIYGDLKSLSSEIYSSYFAPDMLQYTTMETWLTPRFNNMVDSMKYLSFFQGSNQRIDSPIRLRMVESLLPKLQTLFTHTLKELNPIDTIIKQFRENCSSTDKLGLEPKKADQLKDGYARTAENEFNKIIHSLNPPQLKFSQDDAVALFFNSSSVVVSPSVPSNQHAIAALFETQTCLQHFGEEKLNSGDTASQVDRNSPLIRRKLSDYAARYSEHKILLLAGHSGMFSGEKYHHSFSNDMSWYAVDICWSGDENPDAVLDIQDSKDMAYFPDNWATTIYADDRRFADNDSVLASAHRILKIGGQFCMPLSTGMLFQQDFYWKDENPENPDAKDGFWVQPKARFTLVKSYVVSRNIDQQTFLTRLNEIVKQDYKQYGFSNIKVIDTDGGYLMIFTK